MVSLGKTCSSIFSVVSNGYFLIHEWFSIFHWWADIIMLHLHQTGCFVASAPCRLQFPVWREPAYTVIWGIEVFQTLWNAPGHSKYVQRTSWWSFWPCQGDLVFKYFTLLNLLSHLYPVMLSILVIVMISLSLSSHYPVMLPILVFLWSLSLFLSLSAWYPAVLSILVVVTISLSLSLSCVCAHRLMLLLHYSNL